MFFKFSFCRQNVTCLSRKTFSMIFVERGAGIVNNMFRLKLRFRIFLRRTKKWLAGFSFRTGLIVLGVCVLFYILSFAQMLLPISSALKATLWFWLFGLAKLFQYSGLAIIGVEGVKRLRMRKKLKEKCEK